MCAWHSRGHMHALTSGTLNGLRRKQVRVVNADMVWDHAALYRRGKATTLIPLYSTERPAGAEMSAVQPLVGKQL